MLPPITELLAPRSAMLSWESTGTSRIDAILANGAAASLVDRAWHDWQLSHGFDHVVLGVALRGKEYIRGGLFHQLPPNLVSPPFLN